MPELRVLFFLLGSRNKASSRVRGFWIAEELVHLGAKCSLVFGNDRMSYIRCLCRLPWYDTLYIQKRCSKWDYYIIRIANLMGKRTIFDIDDAYSRVKSERTLSNIKRIMQNVSAVTAGSKELLTFAKQYQQKTYLIPSSIKLEHYELPDQKKTQSSRVCLGWIGNGRHYCRDLIEILQEPLIEIAAQHNICLKIVGACEQEELYQAFSDIPGLETILIDSIDWVDHFEVRKAMLEFDVGLYPVLDNDFNLYKCGFKALEYMALGIPVVASPVGANTYVVSNGIDGYHARTTKEWVDALISLISDSTMRKRMGQAGRDKVEKQYNVSCFSKELIMIMNQ